jgi:hypothetical protein
MTPECRLRRFRRQPVSDFPVRAQAAIYVAILVVAIAIMHAGLESQLAGSHFDGACAAVLKSALPEGGHFDTKSRIGKACDAALRGTPSIDAIEQNYGTLDMPWYTWLLVGLAFLSLLTLGAIGDIKASSVAIVLVLIAGFVAIQPVVQIGNQIAHGT